MKLNTAQLHEALKILRANGLSATGQRKGMYNRRLMHSFKQGDTEYNYHSTKGWRSRKV